MAVGNGRANNTNKGVAPDADIIVVETDFGLPNWTLTIADACDYIFKVADSLGKPAVVNLSLGTYLGSHDGKDPAAEYIDQLFKINWQSLEPKRNGEFDYPYNRITSIELYSNDHNLKSTTLKTPCYIINVAAVKTEIEAKTVSEKLRLQGKKSNYLWIPDYPSLSGVNYFSVFIGPYNSQYECEVATEEYKVLNPNAYGLLVSHERKRVRINGIGKVITTNN
jgi:hypothetical protein